MRQWGWRAGLTRPQIDLLLADQPVVDYKHDKKKGKDDWKERKASSWKLEEAAERWREEQKSGTNKTTFSLAGYDIGDVAETIE